jgi:hypothetical protein
MKKAALVFLLLLALPAVAHAALFDYIATIAVFVANVYAGNYVGAAVIFAAALYGENQQRKQRDAARRFRNRQRRSYNDALRDRTITDVTTDAPHVYVYGRARVGSTVVAILPSGPRDEYQHIIAIHAAHECDAFEEIYINGKALGALDSEGFCLSPDYNKEVKVIYTTPTLTNTWTINTRFIAGTIQVFKIEGGFEGEAVSFTLSGNRITVDEVGEYRTRYTYNNSSVRVRTHLGTPGEAADPVMISECGGRWTADSKLSGYCYTYVRLDLNQQEFQGGLPGIEALLRGKKIYDPRTNTTAWSQNNALVIYDYLRSEICGVPTADIPVDILIDAANACDDEIADNSQGNGRRYYFNGTVNSDEDKDKVLDLMARSMAGSINSTTWEIYPGLWREPTLTLVQSDVVGAIAITPGESDSEKINGVTGQFISAENGYAPSDIKPYQSSVYVAADGRELYDTLEFPYTDTTQQCHNLARIHVEDSRNSFTVQMTFSLKAWDTRVGQRVTLDMPFFGFNNKVFRIIGRTYQPAASVELLLKEDDPSIWDQADAVTVDATPNTGLPDPFQVPTPRSLTLSSGTEDLFIQNDGTVVSRIKAVWPVPSNIYASQAEFQIKPIDQSVWQTVALVDSSIGVASIGPVQDGVTYDVQMRFINPVLSITGNFIQAAPHFVLGKSLPPDAPESVVVVGQQVYFVGNAGDLDLAGYYLRSVPGSVSNWGAGQPLHEGFTTVIPFTIPIRLFGVQTIMVVAVDTSGNISEVASTTHNFGTAALDNVVESFDYEANGFPGTLTDCTVDSDSLLADPDPAESVYSLIDVYSEDEVYATTYLPMMWETPVFTAPYNGVIQFIGEYAGNILIEYRYNGGTANDLYSLTDTYAETDLYMDDMVWRTWPGALTVTRNEGIIFRISIEGGSTRGAVYAAVVYFTMNTVRQTFGVVAIDSGGTRLAPLDGVPPYPQWVSIQSVQVTPVASAGGAAYPVVQDLALIQGPEIKLFNTSAVAVDGQATIEIGGLADV